MPSTVVQLVSEDQSIYRQNNQRYCGNKFVLPVQLEDVKLFLETLCVFHSLSKIAEPFFEDKKEPFYLQYGRVYLLLGIHHLQHK